MAGDRDQKTRKYGAISGSEYEKIIGLKCFIGLMLKSKVRIYSRLKIARNLNFGYFAGPSSPFILMEITGTENFGVLQMSTTEST